MALSACALVSSLLWGVACSASPDVEPSGQAAPLSLEPRAGERPSVPHRVPHQQLDQNSPPEVLKGLRSFLFGLEHVEEGPTRTSLPSARGAFIKPGVRVNSTIRREFTHVHMEPGPGSQHLVLTEANAALAVENGWAVKHPWSDRLAAPGTTLLMVYAPRNAADLEQIEKIVTAAAELADLTVLHYEADFDAIADVTGQSGEWVVARGAAD